MTRRIWIAVALLAVAVLAALAFFRYVPYRPEPLAPHGESAAGVGKASRPQLEREALASVEGAAVRDEAAEARREDPVGEPGPSSQDLARYEELRTEAEPVARRFFGAFARYEFGALDGQVRSTLRETVTPELAGELLEGPPRLPLEGSTPERAVLRRLEFVPGEVASGRIAAAELVGVVGRGGLSEPIALELERRGDGWRVSGLGR